ncbi:sialidase family protein [Sphingomonas hengshuiensis]|uniref:Sialidase domain-containing protein n=1 Tax=Sphingomonas hengshuiensis TaxID=1609977 RepID=A0A7U4J9A5_9SPHN|nr:sialidase family protein [Sphingomonas hengshuiensis]AJP72532.1 hypothetical protein TS85_13235 [Sphingomonas hengshuiensis]
MLSGEDPAFSAAVPEIAVDIRNPNRVAIVWRHISMADANQDTQRSLICHLSLSIDGGRSFTHQQLDWSSPETPVCNSPYVDIGPKGELMIGATLAGVLPQGAPEGSHPYGKVGMRISLDWGRNWKPTQGLIASDHGERFVLDPAIPVEATKVPWDGGRGVIDSRTGAITVSGGFPAPPGEKSHSQRFFTVSSDGGTSWGPIRAWGGAGWPQRWDGTMVSAHGKLAVSYLADAVPVAAARCLCIVFATSDDGGETFTRHLVAEADGFDRLVHYPPIAAHPLRDGTYALANVTKESGTPIVRLSADGGAHWRLATMPAAPPGVVRASRPAIAYAEDGTLVLLWRGYRADRSYHVFMAAAREDGRFGAAVQVSTQASLEPEIYLKDYSVRGDFISAVGAGGGTAHGAWTDWRSGKVGQISYVRMPLDRLLPQ